MKILSYTALVFAVIFPLAGLFTVVYSIMTKAPGHVVALCVSGAAATFLASAVWLLLAAVMHSMVKK